MSIETKLAEIEARANAATCGPWRSIPGDSYDAYPSVVAGVNHFILYDHSETNAATAQADFKFPGIYADAEFIAHSRTDVERLLAALRFTVDTLNDPLSEWRDEDREELAKIMEVAR